MHIRRTYLLLSVAMLLSSCIYERIQEEQRVPVRAVTSAVTRATDDLYISAFDGGESIELYMDDGSATTHSTYTISTTDHTTISGGSLSYPSGTSGSVTLFGVYPAASTARHTVRYDQTSDANYKASDLMYTTKSVALSDKANIQSLTFTHQLVKLRLVVKKSPAINQVTRIRMANVMRTAPVTIGSNSLTVGTAVSTTSGDNADYTNGDYILISSGETASYTAANYVYACVFPAQEWAGTNFIEIEADGQTAAFQLTRSTWIPGNEYELILNLGLMNLGATVAISDWGDGSDCTITPTSSSGGTLLVDPVEDQKYNGSPWTPTPRVTYNGIELTAGTDYDMTYYNNTNVGSAMIMALGKNNTIYTGQLGFRSFYIAQGDGTVAFTNATATTYCGGVYSHTRNPLIITGDGTPSYSSSDLSVATVNASTGDVTPVSPGTTVITATMTDGPNYAYASTASYTLTVSARPKLPIEYVAEHNMYSSTNMADNDYPSRSYFFNWSTACSNFDGHVTINDYNGTALSGKYHLPTVQEWMSIVAPYYATSSAANAAVNVDGGDGVRIVFGNNVKTQTGLGETLQWGRHSDDTWTMPSTKFYNEYKTNSSYTSTTNGVTRKYGYAIRLKETDTAGPDGYGSYTCAYRYTYTDKDPDCNNLPSLRVTVCYLGASSTTTLDDIADASYWSQPGAEYFEVILPACGYTSGNASAASSASYTTHGYYWSATSRDGSYAFSMYFGPSLVFGDNWSYKSSGFSVRLFADE